MDVARTALPGKPTPSTRTGAPRPLDVECAGNLYFTAFRWSCRLSGGAHGLPRRPGCGRNGPRA
eukprot:568528-Prymnesium_polylepis.1